MDAALQGTLIETTQPHLGLHKKVAIESYGCAMNFSDSEIVASILAQEGYDTTQNLHEADLILINTCSIRDKAEQTVRKRLAEFNAIKKKNKSLKVGVLWAIVVC